MVVVLSLKRFNRYSKLAFTSLALAAVLAEKVWGRLWPIAEIGMNPRQRKANEAKSVFIVFITAPFMVLLPVVGIPRPLIPDQSSSRSGGCVVSSS